MVTIVLDQESHIPFIVEYAALFADTGFFLSCSLLSYRTCLAPRTTSRRFRAHLRPQANYKEYMQCVVIWNSKEIQNFPHEAITCLEKQNSEGTAYPNSSQKLANEQSTIVVFLISDTWRKTIALLHQDTASLSVVSAEQRSNGPSKQVHKQPL
eukprot:1143046-Pelagomonas_calceolata.AAC.3